MTVQELFPGLMVLSGITGLLINYGIGIKETVLCQYMRDKINIGNDIIALLIKDEHTRIQIYFNSER